jgi:hypothetical protein
MSFTVYIAKDIAHTEDGKLIIEDGDIKVEESDNIHQKDIIISHRGDWRFKPHVGVNIFQYLNSSGAADEIRQSIQEQLTRDGYKVESIMLTTEGQLTINAKRIR